MAPTKPSSITHVVGVDLGGTNVRARVLDRTGAQVDPVRDAVGYDKRESHAKNGAERVFAAVASCINAAIDNSGVAREAIGGVGMAVPGHIDPVTGVVHWSPNFGEMDEHGKLRIFLGQPFCGPISEILGLPCHAGNDANVAALGEFAYGAGKGCTDIVMFTLGTGIGSGVITGERLLTGSTGGAAELGHQAIVTGGRQCGCGSFGCLEAYCGTAAILERGHRAIEKNGTGVLFSKLNGDRTTLTPLMISQAAAEGDTDAAEVWQDFGYYLGIGVGNAVNAFNPQKVILGGGIRAVEGLIDIVTRSMHRHAIHSIYRTCTIVLAELGDDAGIIGAGALAWEKLA